MAKSQLEKLLDRINDGAKAKEELKEHLKGNGKISIPNFIVLKALVSLDAEKDHVRMSDVAKKCGIPIITHIIDSLEEQKLVSRSYNQEIDRRSIFIKPTAKAKQLITAIEGELS